MRLGQSRMQYILFYAGIRFAFPSPLEAQDENFKTFMKHK